MIGTYGEAGALELMFRALDSLRQPVFIKNEQLRIVFANQAALDLAGRPAEAVAGACEHVLLDAGDADFRSAGDRKLLDEDGSLDIEEPAGDGRISVSSRTAIRFGDEGNPQRALMCTRMERLPIAPYADAPAGVPGAADLSLASHETGDGEAVAARQNIPAQGPDALEPDNRNSENALFRALADAIPTAIYAKDENLRAVFGNRAWAELIGKPLEACIGRTDVELFGEAGARLMESDRNTLETGERQVNEELHGDGAEARTLHSTKDLFTAPDGSRYIVGATTDTSALVSQRKALEDANRRAGVLAADLQATIDSLDMGVVVVGSDMRAEMVNSAFHRIWKTDPADFGERPLFRELMDINRHNGIYPVADEEWEAYVTARIEAIREGGVAPVEMHRADGACLLYSVTNLNDGRRLVTYFDITDQKHREAEIEAARRDALMADRAKSEFLANMSHEIRTPMNGVMGMAELLAKTNLDARQQMFTNIIVKSGASLLTIINDILDFSKIDAGQLELDPQPFHLAEAIEDVATLVSSRVAEKDLEMIVRIDPELPEMLVGDAGRLRQIITNLLGNAIKFTEFGHVFVNVGGQVSGEGADAVARLEFRVEDTGIGIPEENLGRIFEKFSQVDGTSSRRHEGTGLGLAITSSLVRLMGGQVGVESEVGKGSAFFFSIDRPVHGEASRRRAIPYDVSGARILVVDDNEVNRAILSEQMAAWKFDSATTTSGSEALELFRAATARGIAIDCVVLDYQMPEMNGGDVVRQLRGLPGGGDVPVIMLTSVDQTEDGRTFSSLGITAHLTKPARSSALLEQVIAAISEYRMMAGVPRETLASEPETAAVDAQAAIPAVEEPMPGAEEPALPVPQVTAQAGIVETDPGDEMVDILVCEDNEVNQIVFTQILEVTPWTFALASDGRKAVLFHERVNPRVILMDVSMPEMNGIEATEAIRRAEAGTGRHTPIIGVTAHAIKGDREKCLAAGMDDYLPKPVSPDALIAKITKWLTANGAEAAARI